MAEDGGKYERRSRITGSVVRLAGQRAGAAGRVQRRGGARRRGADGPAPRGWSRLALGELHRTLALFCVAFLGLHVVTAILDPYVTIGWAATVLPFASRTGRWRSASAPWPLISAAPCSLTSLARPPPGLPGLARGALAGLPGLAGRLRALGHRPATTCGSGGSPRSSGAAPPRSPRPSSPASWPGGGRPDRPPAGPARADDRMERIAL